MTSPKHTPGPWAVHPVHARVDCAKPSKLGGLLPVAQMLWPTTERSEAETEANAHLIAAAPDLLAAVESAPIPASGEEMMAFRDRVERWKREVKAPAIAKATGAA